MPDVSKPVIRERPVLADCGRKRDNDDSVVVEFCRFEAQAARRGLQE